jgi:hypothetical protein
MVERRAAKRPRVLVPFEVGSFMRAPFGWSNRMRRDEGWPERGTSKRVPIGLWGNLAVGLGLYGGPVLGALLGWQWWGGWIGAAIGCVLGTGLGMAIFGLVALGWTRVRPRPAEGGAAPRGPSRSP